MPGTDIMVGVLPKLIAKASKWVNRQVMEIATNSCLWLLLEETAISSLTQKERRYDSWVCIHTGPELSAHDAAGSSNRYIAFRQFLGQNLECMAEHSTSISIILEVRLQEPFNVAVQIPICKSNKDFNPRRITAMWIQRRS